MDRSFTRACLLATFLSALGCAACLPRSVDRYDAKALPPDQQVLIDRLKADERRCRQAAEITTRQKIPVGNAVEEVEMHLTEDLHSYRQCMERAGWKLPAVDGLQQAL